MLSPPPPHNLITSETAQIREQIRAQSALLLSLRADLSATQPISPAPPARSQQPPRQGPSQTSHVLPATPAQLSRAPPTTTQEQSPLLRDVVEKGAADRNYGREALYRLGAGATMFEVKDPDPFAVDEGKVVGVRIEAFVEDKFLPPYYILLNRPRPTTLPHHLRIHKHTIPAVIPLEHLAALHLPQPAAPSPDHRSIESLKPPKPQDLPRLVRSLRHEVTSYHLRRSHINALRKTFNLKPLPLPSDIPLGRSPAPPAPAQSSKGSHGIRDISLVDAAAMGIRIEWVDGRIGRVGIGKGGELTRCVVFGREGKEREVERLILRVERVERLADVLKSLEFEGEGEV
ncbi:MAG: hypothetical protein M1817_001476 [Caeruleum heppii]|nr:MAG: hypothetical protein M1817_001476 [Caeruleum heppii]